MDMFRRPVSGISDPVYTTPNAPLSSSSPSSSPSASRSSRSPSSQPSSSTPSKSVSFASPTQLAIPLPASVNLGEFDWANIIAATKNTAPSTPTVSSPIFNLPSDPVTISQRLTELLKKEGEIAARKNNLKAQLAEIESEETELSSYRSQLIHQINKVLSPQLSVSPKPPTVQQATSPAIRPRDTTIIEDLGPEPAQPRSLDSNASMTPMTKKRPGPASKTCISGLKVINPGSLPPLGPVSSSSKKSQKDGDDSSKRPVTTGVKQSRPQPMRARKRNKPDETGSSTVPQSNTPAIDQANKESQLQPKSKVPAQPQIQVQAQPQSKPSTPPHKSQLPIVKNPVAKEIIKTEPRTEETPRIPSATLKKNDLQTPSPFKEIEENISVSEPLAKKIKKEPGTKQKKTVVTVAAAKDEDTNPIKSNPIQGGGDDEDEDAHSDSEIFDALRSVQLNGDTPEIGVKKIKKDPDQPPNLVVPNVETQEATRREPNIKQEK